MNIRISGVARNSVVDGPGIRYVVFAQGCPFDCEGCHNPQTHDFDGGELTDTEIIAGEIKKDPLLSGATFSGGEPFAQAKAFIDLAKRLGGANIVCYTGYTFEELYRSDKPETRELLSLIDVLVDGRFDKSKKSLELKFRGSANQRAIDSKESVKRGKAIEIIL
ncbi:MAG: anaerobic ribonucleoside-triphosphate reductase activating protein [Oscillospiraceae bacterium]|jgi:anaerobic ribonucleoside-triphosphate reductase activating protein|nr:anaerobic ribonucleoside-triphosphate reductase activating protein [Oscillospiraceae bacterium]